MNEVARNSNLTPVPAGLGVALDILIDETSLPVVNVERGTLGQDSAQDSE